jgi:hypothetical protein
VFDRGCSLKLRQAWKQGQTGFQTQATAVDLDVQELSAPRRFVGVWLFDFLRCAYGLGKEQRSRKRL